MSNIINNDPFLRAIDSYKIKEMAIEKDFLVGILGLGKILLKERKVWKEKDRWLEYLEGIEKSLAGANQFIRLYEYSIDNMKTLEKAGITNWSKVNAFLSISEKLKNKIAEKLEGKSVLSSTEFKEEVAKIKEAENLHNESYEELEEEGEIDFSKAMKNILKKYVEKGVELNNIKTKTKQRIATEIINNVNRTSPKKHQMSDSSKIVLVKIIDIKLATVVLKAEAENLSSDEKKLWGDMLVGDNKELEEIIYKKYLK